MNTLTHSVFRSDGIIGTFRFDGDDADFMATLEHAFPSVGSWVPIIGPGIYRCVRGKHRLESMPPGVTFETFEILAIEGKSDIHGHTKLLFHWGNFNRDSKGCVLCGETAVTNTNGENMVTSSRKEFAEFMKRLDGVNEFEMEVVNA